MNDVAVIECSGCKNIYKIPVDKIPSSGMKGKCKKCNAQMEIYPDLHTSGAALIKIIEEAKVEEKKPAGTVTDANAKWEILLNDQVLGPFGIPELKEIIKAKRLNADDMVRVIGGNWEKAGAFLALSELFKIEEQKPEIPAGRLGDEEHCHAHSDCPSLHKCSQCYRYLCSKCVKEGPTTHTGEKILVCGICGGLVSILKKRIKWTPFYKDLNQVFGAPFKGYALLYTGFIMLFEILKIPSSFTPVYGLAAIIMLTIVQITFYVHLIREVANGSYEFPEWNELPNMMDMVGTFLKVIIVCIISLIPAVLIGIFVGTGLGIFAVMSGNVSGLPALLLILYFIIFLFYTFYLPVSIAIVAIFNTIVPAINPVIIFRIIFRIGTPYFIAVFIWVLLEGAGIASVTFFTRIPFLGAVINAPIKVYLDLVSCYLLGRVAYENEEKIGWY